MASYNGRYICWACRYCAPRIKSSCYKWILYRRCSGDEGANSGPANISSPLKCQIVGIGTGIWNISEFLAVIVLQGSFEVCKGKPIISRVLFTLSIQRSGNKNGLVCKNWIFSVGESSGNVLRYK